jgi:hypothetical protein
VVMSRMSCTLSRKKQHKEGTPQTQLRMSKQTPAEAMPCGLISTEALHRQSPTGRTRNQHEENKSPHGPGLPPWCLIDVALPPTSLRGA